MAEEEKQQKKKTDPKSVVLAVVVCVVLAVLAVYRLAPGLLGGEKSPTKTGTTAANRSAVAPGNADQSTAEVATEIGGRVVADPLASFLVKFGRANPFAATRGGVGSPGSTTSGGGSLQDLQQRAQNLANGGTSGSGTNSGGNYGTRPATGQTNGGFILTGIVRLQNNALAVIRNGDKAYIVALGEALEKTGFVLKKFEENKVTIASDGKEYVLVLGGKKDEKTSS